MLAGDIISFLDGDYLAGLELLKTNRVKFSDEEKNRLIKVLKANKFVYSEETKSLVKRFPFLYKLSLENDYVTTLKNTKNYGINKYKMIMEFFKENNISYSMLPNEIVTNVFFNGSILNPVERRFANRCINRSFYFYNKSDEQILLNEVLNVSYKTIEDYIVSIKNKRRDELKIMDIYALGFYAKKLLSTNHTPLYSLNLFDYKKYRDELYGEHDKGRYMIKLFNGYDDNTVENMVHVLHHEVAHAKQGYNIDNLRVSNDEDIDYYLEDKILIKCLDLEYKEKNYRRLSFEFDADCKARVMDINLFKEAKDNSYEEYLRRSGYYLNYKRSYQNRIYHLDQLFLKLLNDKEYSKRMEDELYKSGLLYVKFKKEKGKYVLATPSDLRKTFLETSDNKEKKIAYNLLKRYLVNNSKITVFTNTVYLNKMKYKNMFKKVNANINKKS